MPYTVHQVFSYPLFDLGRALCHQLQAQGFTAVIIGGAVRDALLGRTPHDCDIATNARPTDIEATFADTLDLGKAFGTITVCVPFQGRQHRVEITTFRSERTYSNQRHPDDVVFESCLQADVQRRDFTINALAYDPITCTLIDHTNGLADLEARRLATIGDPITRFTEDSLRLFRCCRFSAQLPVSPTTDCLTALCTLGPDIALPSAHRITHELNTLLTSAHPEKGLSLLKECGLAARLFPSLSQTTIARCAVHGARPQRLQQWATLLATEANLSALANTTLSKKEQTLIGQLIRHDGNWEKATFTIKDLALSGQHLQALGLAGPAIGKMQRYLYARVCTNLAHNTPETLLAWTKQAIQDPAGPLTTD